MSKPRIAILHYSAPPIIGGVESTIRDHALLFAAHGYPVKIIAGRGEPFDPRISVEIIPEIHSRAERVDQVQSELKQGMVSPDFNAFVSQLYAALQYALSDTDVLIAHNVLTLHKNLALTVALHRLLQESPLRVLAWHHDFAWTDPVYDNELHPGEPWSLLREPWASVKHVVVSQSRRNELADLFKIPETEIFVVPPGLDTADFLKLGETAAQWTRQFNLLQAEPLLLLPARVTRRKNIELAIDVTGELQKLGMQPKLLVMGPLGPHNPANRSYLNELRERRTARGVEDAVIFLDEHGHVDDLTRRDLYMLADALFFPSAREGFGIPILEAGLVRLPIFCADIPPFRESAQEYANYFSLTESPIAIAQRVQIVLGTNPQYVLKHRVTHAYSWEHIFTHEIEPLIQT